MRHLTFCAIALLAMLNCTDSSSNSGEEEVYTPPVPPGFECVDGLSAGTYPCNNIDLVARVSASELRGSNLNDIWGWKDPQTEKEYALVGLTDGVTFVDVTNPDEPIVVGKLPESNISAKYKVLTDPNYEACQIGIGETEYSKNLQKGSAWRDHKVYNNHLYIGSDSQPHGVQVFDLTKLRGYNGSFIEFNDDNLYAGLANSHNIVINEETGFLYATGATNADTCNTAGLHILDLSTPSEPVFAGCYEDATPPRQSEGSAYIHDAQCVIYNGPDTEHAGKEVCFNAAERSLAIADVTDKQNLQTIGFATQPYMDYAHQGWLTEDQQYFIMNDELDEINLGRNTKSYVFDVRDLDNPVFIDYYTHNTFSIDHNMYVKGDYVYASNYNSGLRILKMDNIAEADLSLAAFFDTQPTSDQNNFSGAWSVYPYFDSGIVIVSDIADGLFILKPNLN